MAAAQESSVQSNTRWWESYLVRYFLGFIVGAVCIAVLLAYGVLTKKFDLLVRVGSHLPDISKISASTWVIALSLLGLGYCYLASTPITVLHAGRYRSGAVDGASRFFWFGWILSLVFVSIFGVDIVKILNCGAVTYFTLGLVFLCAAISLNWSALRYVDMRQRKKVWIAFAKLISSRGGRRVGAVDSASECRRARRNAWFVVGRAMWRHRAIGGACNAALMAAVICFWSVAATLWLGQLQNSSFIRLFVFGTPVIWICLAQYAVLFRLLGPRWRVNRFTSKLVGARLRPGSREIRDTYSHLREHSNSIFIVIVELCLLAMLLAMMKAITQADQLPSAMIFLLFGIGLWTVPTIFMWSRANALERAFAEHPMAFLSDSATSAPAEVSKH